jgi:PIN domain nuclease of toxin-antitoxin system
MIDKSEIYVSAASIWEISIKTALGKLDADPGEVLAAVEPAGFAMLSISGEHAAAVARLGGHHKDPFDRLLIAQALVEPMHLLSNDELLGAYGAFVIIA